MKNIFLTFLLIYLEFQQLSSSHHNLLRILHLYGLGSVLDQQANYLKSLMRLVNCNQVQLQILVQGFQEVFFIKCHNQYQFLNGVNKHQAIEVYCQFEMLLNDFFLLKQGILEYFHSLVGLSVNIFYFHFIEKSSYGIIFHQYFHSQGCHVSLRLDELKESQLDVLCDDDHLLIFMLPFLKIFLSYHQGLSLQWNLILMNFH